MYKVLLSFMICLFLSGCGSKTALEFHEEGNGITRSIVRELKAVQTRKELVQACPKLKKLFNDLVTVIISAQEFQLKHPEYTDEELDKTERGISEELRVELNRIYKIDGARELIEKCQEEALFRLDAFEKKLNEMKSYR